MLTYVCVYSRDLSPPKKSFSVAENAIRSIHFRLFIYFFRLYAFAPAEFARVSKMSLRCPSPPSLSVEIIGLGASVIYWCEREKSRSEIFSIANFTCA